MSGQRRDALVQARVVLHRARAERVEARVEIEVPLRQADVVAHDLRLGDLRQPRRLLAAEALPAAARASTCGTSSSGHMNARRPGAPFSKIVRARSRCSGSSSSPGVMPPPSARSARRRAAPEHVDQPVDVGARALLGDRHEQPAAILSRPVIACRSTPGFTPAAQRSERLTAATSASRRSANSRITGWACSASTPSSALSVSRA